MRTKEIIDLTKRLIAFESIETKPEKLRAIISFVADYLKKNTQLKVKKFAANHKYSLIATGRPFAEAPPKVIFHDHLDVVPGQPEQFKPFIKGDKIFGRGASDTKANGAVLMVLAKELSAKKIPDLYPRLAGGQASDPGSDSRPNVGFMFTTDEEVSGKNGTAYLLAQGYRCQFFVTLEPTHFDLVPAHKGILWLRVKVKGQTGHASRPWHGKNAGLLAYQGLRELYKFYPLPREEAWRTTINLGGIAGGDAFNRILPECELKLDIRFVEKDKPQEIIARVHRSFPGAEIEIVENEPPMKTSLNNAWVKKLAASVKRVTGRKPSIHRGHGACDGRFYSAAGIPAVELGTVSKGLHTDEEYVRISTLPTFYKILWDFVNNL